MSDKRIQLYLSEGKDRLVYDLVERLEDEGGNKRGYVTDQLKERIRAFEMLANYVGETDPLAVVMKLSAGLDGRSSQPKPQTVPPKKEEQAESNQSNNRGKLLGFANEIE